MEAIYEQLKVDIGLILRELCKRKEVEIIEAETYPDHVHMFISMPPKLSVSSFMGFLKGKSTRMIFERHANLKYIWYVLKYLRTDFSCVPLLLF